MEEIYLLIWFYVYAGLMFGTVSNTASLFPKLGPFWQVMFWPIFLSVHLFNQLKNSDFGWFVRYIAYKATH